MNYSCLYFESAGPNGHVGRWPEYDLDAQTLRIIVADEKKALRCTVTGIPEAEAVRLVSICMNVGRLDEDSFEQAAAWVLNADFQTLQ